MYWYSTRCQSCVLASSLSVVLPKKNDIDIFRTTSTSVNITYDLPVDDDAYESCTVRVHYSPIANDQVHVQLTKVELY